MNPRQNVKKVNGKWVATDTDQILGITITWVLNSVFDAKWIELLQEAERQEEVFKYLNPEE